MKLNKAQQIVQQSTTDLLPYARNSRTHSTEQIAQIAASIQEFGFTNPVLVDENNGIVAGHGRVLAAQSLGMEEVPTINIGWMSEAQRRAYVIADNQLALNAGWDESILAEEVAWLNEQNFSTDLLGFDPEFLEDLLADDEPVSVGLTDDDAAPTVRAEAVSVPGDVWILGKHRVMCGDSTSIDAFDSLMRGQSADMVFTDPPYGMSYEGGRGKKNFGMIKGDDAEGENLISLVQEALATAKAHSKEGSAFYVCFPWRTYAEFGDALKACGIEVSACIVWDKKSIGLGHQHYRPQHEFIFYSKGGNFHGDRSESDVWYMGRGNTGAYVHPTQKPVELVQRAVGNSSKAGDVVVDCFGGSGSTLIACEKSGRHARLMELDPKYVDVIVRRWQEFTGKQAVLESTGEPFPAETAAAEAREDAAAA